MSIHDGPFEELFKKWNDLKKKNGPCPFCGLHTLEHRLLLSGRLWTHCQTCDPFPVLRPDLEARVIAHWTKWISQEKENLNEH
jgi:hypothetical protein